MVESQGFRDGQSYINAYFMVLDIQGSSKLVSSNEADKVDEALGEFERVVYDSVQRKAKHKRCGTAKFWGWQGDGGLCVFYDDNESFARETATESAKEILAEIPSLNDRIGRMKFGGEIHVRIALHKGSFKYKEKPGSIHSVELNLISHAQKAVPVDCLAISKQVYDVCGIEKTDFHDAESTFEDNQFYIYSKRPKDDVLREWKQNSTISGENRVALESDVALEQLGLRGAFMQRGLTREYVRLMDNAYKCIWALGVGLGGFQRDYRDQILLKKANEGVDIRLLVADPDVVITFDKKKLNLPSMRDFETDLGTYNADNGQTITRTIDDINEKIKTSKLAKKTYIRLKFYRTLPTLAILRVDSNLYFSPYFIQEPNWKSCTFKVTSGGRLFEQCVRHFQSIWDNSKYSTEASKLPRQI
ncbi:MAG TPA: hypothetical protein VJ249_01605 [Candidatus Bathyarchaeia archaeon]|nr:hypothetical protein [Candidatus Bathyarchaeia archaeon]